MLWIRTGVLALLLGLGACSSAGADGGPVQTLKLFLEAMDRSAGQQEALKEAYELLDTSARQALQERATKAEALSGRTYAPWEMLVQGRFRLRFAPSERGGMRARIKGDQASVLVQGDKPGQQAEIPMVKEDGRWRIVLIMPPLRREAPAQPAVEPAPQK